jgi:hypothetical protein
MPGRAGVDAVDCPAAGLRQCRHPTEVHDRDARRSRSDVDDGVDRIDPLPQGPRDPRRQRQQRRRVVEAAQDDVHPAATEAGEDSEQVGADIGGVEPDPGDVVESDDQGGDVDPAGHQR